jgi:short-subunit dehydrogenase
MYFKDKVVWITGASSGIGEGLAYAFSKLGAKLILSARRENELERVKQNCQNPAEVYILPLDLNDVASLKSKAEMAINKWGRLDVLVNNGGISQRGIAGDTKIEVVKKMMEINFFSYIELATCVLPQMKKQKSGHIVNISSILGKVGLPLRSAYAASKHALHGYFDSLREEVLKDNIHVMLVCPGYVKTNVTLNAITETGEPLGKMLEGQANGIEPDVCARKIIKGIKNRRAELVIGGYETLTIYFKRYWPGLYRQIMRRIKTG